MHLTENIIRIGTMFLGALVLSGALVAITIQICRKQGWVAKPRSDRWHKGTPSLFGGVPIWLTCMGLGLLVVPFSDRVVWKMLGASSLIFLLGFADDVLHLRPHTKLAAQILAAL